MEDLSYSSRQATYDLRRLIRKGVIYRIPGTQRYLVSPLGRRVAVWFAKTNGRVLTPGLAWLDPTLPPDIASRSRLALTWRAFDRAVDEFIADQIVAAAPARAPTTPPPRRPSRAARSPTTTRVSAA